ncbi:MAG: RagB/SusD family nutrient uptake outer membrane protein [Alistipes sp.]|jgi:hypothetical protein|nr:RagB/SusD family nutrient uptake outer membrane protein [Alistipes sp.]
MKRYISKAGLAVALTVTLASCDFLGEDPKTFLSPDNYYNSEAQVIAAVNGGYTFLDDIFGGDIERGTQVYLFMDYLAGYAIRPYAGASTDIYQTQNLTVEDDNLIVAKFWQTAYTAIENSNSVIEGITGSVTDDRNIMPAASRDKLLGEVYFTRAHFYFNLVRLFGEVPLKTETTKSLDMEITLSSQEDVYTQIVADLTEAERLMTSANAPLSNVDGRITLGAVKSLLAKVYITMAGFPLQKSEYYAKAYDKAKEVVTSGRFTLAADYAAMRAGAFSNSGEYVWALQRNPDEAGSPVHNNTLPYPAPSKPISANSDSGGAMAPHIAFYESYDEGDLRTAEKGFYYTEHEAQDGSGPVTLNRPHIYKWWDSNAASTGKSGANWPLIRYADVLLLMAEAKANADGGTTSDAAAIDAYYQVRHRAMPDEAKPASITVNEVIRERIHELCFEDQTWYDMLRTRKGLNVNTGQIVNLVGLHTPAHAEGAVYGEEDLLFPYPLREVRLNPNLVRQ